LVCFALKIQIRVLWEVAGLVAGVALGEGGDMVGRSWSGAGRPQEPADMRALCRLLPVLHWRSGGASAPGTGVLKMYLVSILTKVFKGVRNWKKDEPLKS
jgi:hypothetical protein